MQFAGHNQGKTLVSRWLEYDARFLGEFLFRNKIVASGENKFRKNEQPFRQMIEDFLWHKLENVDTDDCHFRQDEKLKPSAIAVS